MRLLGIDYGSKRIGLAIGDTDTRLALPLDTLQNRGQNFILTELQSLIAAEKIEKIVVGLPLALGGGRTPQTDVSLNFVSELKKRLALPVVTEDERLTTAEAVKAAEVMKRAAGREARVKTKINRDAAAAAIILQSYLDK